MECQLTHAALHKRKTGMGPLDLDAVLSLSLRRRYSFTGRVGSVALSLSLLIQTPTSSSIRTERTQLLGI